MIHEITIDQLQDMYEKKKISVRELVQEYLNRIHQYDEGKLNSVLEINPDALSYAEELDRNHNSGASKLYGIPILLKDNFDTADRMHTSNGSLALANSIAVKDAKIVATLRKKGAIFLGKTNMTEFANHMTNGMKSGYSSRGGLVLSPYKKGTDPSGSSTGSAVAVTSNFCTASFGTDTSGSIISPAIKNGIVGYRPSTGVLSQSGIIPVSFTLDTAGPMTRNVMDSAIIYSELTSKPLPTKTVYSELVVGIDQVTLSLLSAEEEKKVHTLTRCLKKQGVKIKYIKIPPTSTTYVSKISFFEFKHQINQYLKQLPDNYPIKSLKDIIEFNEQHPEETLVFGQTLFEQTQKTTSGEMTEAFYKKIMQDREATKNDIRKILQDFDVCILFKTNLVLQYIGIAGITIPHGLYNDGSPFGIQLIGNDDLRLLKAALSIEEIFGYRVPPKFS